jgi:hypothetical protein
MLICFATVSPDSHGSALYLTQATFCCLTVRATSLLNYLNLLKQKSYTVSDNKISIKRPLGGGGVMVLVQ